mmetsp:Transcript_21490/g.52241  ORF Transcript_21490/g.52241 Transcript_21490/m.52241 type:complete len:792 (+) Transcript_21490:77-2452(+)
MRVSLTCHILAASAAQGGDNTIKAVVTKLREMLAKNDKQHDEERTKYAKFKCYCDQNTEEKTQEIADSAQVLAETNANLDRLRASNGEKSSEKAEMERELEATITAIKQAVELRQKQHKEYLADQAYLASSIGQLEDAIEILAAVGADQTAGASADHKAAMAEDATAEAKAFLKKKEGLVELRDDVRQALQAASAFLQSSDRKKIVAFLADLGAGDTYSSAAGEIVGILKNMLDTFKENKASNAYAEKKAVEAHGDFLALKKKTKGILEEGISDRDSVLGTNSDSISSDMQTITSTAQKKAEDESFLADLTEQCAEKSKQFDLRKKLHAEEAAAISKAISVLNSDDAFDTFGAVAASKDKQGGGGGGKSFVQLQEVTLHRADAAVEAQTRAAVAASLHSVARARRSLTLARIATAVQEGGAIGVVIEQIEKVLTQIDKEGEMDASKDAFCTKEQTDNNAELDTKNGEIDDLNDQKGKLKGDIEKLQTVIDDTNTDIHQFKEAMANEKESRKTDHQDYNKEMKELTAASDLIDKAIKILDKFFSKVGTTTEAPALLQSKAGGHRAREDPAPPQTFGDAKDFAGQSEEGKAVLKLLADIKAENDLEALKETDEEEDAQVEFEKFMTDTAEDMKRAQEQVADAEAMMANKQEQLAGTREDLKKTEEQKADIEKYLAKIKPGCDFIQENKEKRDAARTEEKTQLEGAITKLKGTPAYKAAVAKETKEGLGDCAEKCFVMCDEQAVEDGKCFKSAIGTPTDEAQPDGYAPCEACKRGVTVAAYCTGEGKGAPGCPA